MNYIHDELDGLLHAVSGLPVECRRVLTLRKVYGWTQAHIAEHLGVEKETVADHLRACAVSFAHFYESTKGAHGYGGSRVDASQRRAGSSWR